MDNNKKTEENLTGLDLIRHLLKNGLQSVKSFFENLGKNEAVTPTQRRPLNPDLKWIKDNYGEQMMHLCRSLFPTQLQTEGAVHKALEQSFATSRTLFEIIKDNNLIPQFWKYIVEHESNKNELNLYQACENKTPEQLMEEAGYKLYPECQTEKDIQKFKHYYANGEKLCTFHGDRLETCRVWFAVKKDAENLRRRDFKNPDRQDEYGTSVISIQFDREYGDLSIKNRYNHTVDDPDATFDNNLDRIIGGLTDAFANTYNVSTNKDILSPIEMFERHQLVKADDGKFYHYNHKINNTYYCDNNIVINENQTANGDRLEVAQYEKSRFIVTDYFLIDMSKNNPSIKLLDPNIEDSFLDSFGEITNISVKKEQGTGHRTITFKVKDGEDVLLTIDQFNRIVKYSNKNLAKVGDNFLLHSQNLEKLDTPNLTSSGEDFIPNSRNYLAPYTKINEDIYSPSNNFALVDGKFVQFDPNRYIMVDYFLIDMDKNNPSIKLIDPKLQDAFVNTLGEIRDISIEETKDGNRNIKFKVSKGEDVILTIDPNNFILKYMNKNVKNIGDGFLGHCHLLTELDMPNTETIGNSFISACPISSINFPNVTEIGNDFATDCCDITEASLPNVEHCGDNFMSTASLKRFIAKNLVSVGDYFLKDSPLLTILEAPSLTSVGDAFLLNNTDLSRGNIRNIRSAGEGFLAYHEKREQLLDIIKHNAETTNESSATYM